MLVSEMTHNDIADWAAMRLRSMGYQFTCSNLTSATHGEQPDVLGIAAYGESILIEVKVSRSDFLADKKKPWRKHPEQGIGDYRVYLTPKGLLTPSDVPYGWQLWEVHGKTRPILKIIKGRARRVTTNDFGFSKTSYVDLHCDSIELNHFKQKYDEKSYRTELSWMWKIIQRAMSDGFEPNQYANKFQKTQAKNQS